MDPRKSARHLAHLTLLSTLAALGSCGGDTNASAAPASQPQEVTQASTPSKLAAAPVTEVDFNRVLGTRIGLTPPEGFEAAHLFTGYERMDISGSIVINEIPGPISQMMATLEEDNVAKQGMSLVESESLLFDGHRGQLAEATQMAGGQLFRKWIALFGNDEASVMLVATVIDSASAEIEADMRSTLREVRWAPGFVVDPMEGLSFTVTFGPRLKHVQRLSNMITLAQHEAPVGPAEPMMVVGSALNEFEVDDLEAFARMRVRAIDQVRGVKKIQGKETTIDGRPAYVLTARAKDVSSPQKLAIYQAIVLMDNSYYLAQGFVAFGRRDEYFEEFDAIARSLRPIL